MGTRADFYVGRGEQAEWLGSKAYDGYPDGLPVDVREAPTETAYRASVAAFLDREDDATLPEQGWPWPWDNSATTDYAYAFDGDVVWGSCFGREWFNAALPEPDQSEDERRPAVFPDMSARKNVTYGKRSGLIVFGA